MREFLNSDGKTYNGVKALAKLSGLSEEEVAWMAKRIVELHAQGVQRAEALRIVREEAVLRPWKKTPR